jgi:hypothetical protein
MSQLPAIDLERCLFFGAVSGVPTDEKSLPA